MEDWYKELKDENELQYAESLESHLRCSSLYRADAMVPDECALQGSLPTEPGDRPEGDLESHATPVHLCEYDNSYTLGTDCQGGFVELCFTADMATVVFSEQQRRLLNGADIATIR
eukprot:6439319-Pyramimonas_sp.AAC.1